jgi:hypothetical protein
LTLRPRLLFSLVVPLAAVLCDPSARAEDEREPLEAAEPPPQAAPALGEPVPPVEGPGGKKHYFYKGYGYGSQALFSPWFVVVSRGLDVLQLHPTQRNPLVGQQWGLNLKNVASNVASPFKPIDHDGWGKFLREEIFPLSWTPATARWAPNYGLHLIGGGMTYRETREWLEDHDVPTPVATTLSILTLYTAAFLNEAIENHGVVGDNTDCLADLYVFDSLGILIYSFDAVAEFFSTTFIVSDWSLQPSLLLPSGDLQNVGNYYAGKVPIPFYPRLRLFAYAGISTLGGLSFVVKDGYSVSGAFGGRVDTFTNLGGNTSVFNVVSMRPSGALFVDKNDSLLASLQVSATSYYTVSANLYPNAFFHTDPGLGLWTAANADGKFIVGVSITRALGMGFGVGTF